MKITTVLSLLAILMMSTTLVQGRVSVAELRRELHRGGGSRGGGGRGSWDEEGRQRGKWGNHDGDNGRDHPGRFGNHTGRFNGTKPCRNESRWRSSSSDSDSGDEFVVTVPASEVDTLLMESEALAVDNEGMTVGAKAGLGIAAAGAAALILTAAFYLGFIVNTPNGAVQEPLKEVGAEDLEEATVVSEGKDVPTHTIDYR